MKEIVNASNAILIFAMAFVNVLSVIRINVKESVKNVSNVRK